MNIIQQSKNYDDRVITNFIKMWTICSSYSNLKLKYLNSIPYTISSIEDPMFNCIIEFFGKNETEIKKVIEFYSHYKKAHCVWLSSKDTKLYNNLKNMNFEHFGRVSGVQLDLDSIKNFSSDLAIYEDKELTIKEILNEFDFSNWSYLLRKRFDMSNSDANKFKNILLSVRNRTEEFKHYVAYLNLEPIAICSVLLDKDTKCAGLYNGASTIKYRKNKAFMNIILNIIKSLKLKNYKYLVAQTTRLSSNSLVKRFKFNIVHQYDIFVSPGELNRYKTYKG